MRVIHNASLIILIIDILKKAPITDAVILLNGIQNPYLRKDTGYCIFCDLQPGEYNIEIFYSGFIKKEFKFILKLGECKKLIFEMPFKSNNHRLLNLPRIEFLIRDKNKKEIMTNQDVRITMKTPINFLKLVNNAKKGSMEIVLNFENNPSFIFQNYIYESITHSNLDNKNDKDKNKSKDEGEDNDEKENGKKNDVSKGEDNDKEVKNIEKENSNSKIFEELFFLGYDFQYNAYILLNELKNDLKIGGNFYPFWNLSSDKQGKVIVPIFSKFMNKSFFDVEVKVNNVSKVVKVDTNKINDKNVIVSRVNLKF